MGVCRKEIVFRLVEFQRSSLSLGRGLVCHLCQAKTSTGSTYMGGCQNYGSFLGPYYNTAPII